MDEVTLVLVLYFCCSVAFALFLGLIILYLTSGAPNLSRSENELYYIDPNDSNKKKAFPSIEERGSIDLSVIVPSYNEEERLPTMMNETMDYMASRQRYNPQFKYEIIIVDDGSKDKTSQVALLYSQKYGTENVRVLTLERNRGKGGAVRLGMLSSRGKLLLFADADGASKFSDIDRLEEGMRKICDSSSTRAVVCGSRAHMESESIVQRSFFRTFLMKGFHMVVFIFGVPGVRDTQCGFKLFTRNAARVIFTNLHVERWVFDVDVLYLAQYFKMPIAEVPVSWEEIDGSKMTPVLSWIQMFKDLLLLRLRYLSGAWTIKDKSS